jgi:LEA14-like dessication related protein
MQRPPARALQPALSLSLFFLGLACAHFGRGLQTPEVSLVDLLPLPSETLEQRFELRVRILNPNDEALAIDGIDLTLDLNDRRLGRALSSEELEIPRLGDEVVALVATTHLLDVLRQAIALPEASGLDYSLHGRIYLSGSPGWLRVSHEGSLLPESFSR